jgi:TP901 family phage tail tape measure protein
MSDNIAASMTASIVIDKNDLLAQILKGLSEGQKELENNKLELFFDFSNSKNKNEFEKIIQKYRKELSSEDLIIQIKNQGVEETIKSLDHLVEVIKSIASGKSFGAGLGNGIGDSIIDEKKLDSIIDLFTKMEAHLLSIKKVLSDVGEGEEFSPLFNVINKIDSSITQLSSKVSNIGLNMNIDFGSDKELEAKVEAKISNALQAYQRLFEHLKLSSVGGSYINNKFFDFDINQFDTPMSKLQAYRKFIENMRIEAKQMFNGQDILYTDTDKKYWNQASAAYGQVTRVFNEMNAASDVNPLENIFGKTDLSGVIEQLNTIVSKLDEISDSAKGFTETLKNGLNVNTSVEEIEKLTNRVKELEDELAKIKTPTIVTTPQESDISSDISSQVKVSDNITDQIVANEKKKQEAYKATAETVIYHAGILSKLNKAETNGRFYGSNRGTGYFGTGHYFVDSSSKHYLDESSTYSKLPYSSIDISQYDNLFKANNDIIAKSLHEFLKNLTRYTQGDTKFNTNELFSQFENVFANTVMDIKEFESRINGLKDFMSKSNLSDRSDSVSTQFMKSLGYGGVDTRGTKFANTEYGTVIYDLKEESVLQANITDELQKQGQMLEKINYEKEQVFDSSEDSRLQDIINQQEKGKAIREEYNKIYDDTKLDSYSTELSEINKKLDENDEIIGNCRLGIENAEKEAQQFAKEMKELGIEMSNEEIQNSAIESKKSCQERIDELEKERPLLESRRQELEANLDAESKLSKAAMERATATVEDRMKDAFPGSSTETKPETEGMKQVEKATEEAIQAKKDFATANEGVQSSIDGSENPLKLEAELMAQIAKSAREAADAKKEFVEKQDEVQKEAKATADTFDNITNSSEKFSGNVEDNFNEIISIIKNTNQDVDDHIEKWKLLKQVGRIGDDAFSAKFQKNDGQTEDWYFKKNDSGTYDVDNKLLTTDYKNFEKIIISAENKLRDLESQRDAIISKSPNASTAGIDKQIAYQKNYVDILDQTAQALRQDNETLLKGAQIEAARNKAAQEYYLNKGAKDDVKNASRVASEEQKRQKSIDQTNRLLNKQQIIIDGIEKSYSKVANPDLDKGVDSQSDLIELANKKAEIQTLLNKLSGQNRNSSNEKEFLQVEKLISEYKQLATDKLKANNPSKQELGGQKLNVLLANQVTQYNKLISQSEKYGDITKEITDELKAQRDLIAEQDKNGIYVARSKKADGSEITANDYYKARDNYKIDKSILGSYEDNIKSASLDKYVNKLFSFQTKTSSYDATIARFENGGWTSPEYLKNIQAVKDAVQKYDALLNKIKTEQNGIASETDIQTLKEYESEIKKTIATVTNMSAAQKGYSLVSGQKELDKIRQILKENSAMSAEAKGKIKAYYREIESGNPSMSLDKIHGEIMKIVNAEAEAGRAGKRMWDVIKEKAWYGAANVIGTYFGVNDIFRYIQQGISTVRELDEAMTEVRKVSDATEASYAKFQKTIASTAKDIATTNKELLNSSADFLRLGYSLDQASSLAKNATLFVNVGDGVDITEATEDMITAMKAFDIQAEDSIKIVDDYNQIGNQFALSATDIGEAMKRSASALETGNNSFEQSISLITAMNEIVQNSENTGNSLKVLSLRLRGAKAELEDMQEDTDGLCESTSKLREQIQSLTGVDIMIDDNTFKSTTDIIKELGAVWDKLSDSSQAAILELIAGKSRANNIAALLKNYQQIDKVMESLGDAEGSAMRENEDIVNSINGRIKTLSATAEEFWKSFISTDLVKNAVSFATSFLNVITKIIDKFGVLPSLITPIVAILSAKNKNFGKLA